MDNSGRDPQAGRRLSTSEKSMVASAVLVVCRFMETVNGLRRAGGRGRGRREAAIAQALADVCASSGLSDAPFLLSNAIVAGVLPRDTPRWWMKRRMGGTWRDLDITDDATDEYFHDKLRMSRAIGDIVAACAPFIDRRLTHYREPLQTDLIIAFALYRWATGETFENSSSSFGIGRSSGVATVTDVANAILAAYPDKVAMPTGRRLLQGVSTTGYLLGDNGYSPRTWMVVPYGGTDQAGDISLFDTRQKTTRGVVERAFGRLKGMWRLFLRHHKTNMDNLPLQFLAVCIIHNLLPEAGIPFDDSVLLEPDENDNLVRVDLGLQDPARPVSQSGATDAALASRDGLRVRMMN
ncbi:hypothetical protein CBR_g34956 [Chara braunii]|uniref:DDE Tnp4 domain-containing protein n=1 Tax=Chara braunii TaxID=69332 RepID=A0A388LJZ2_CHABU|nr:hypothetical protein CBR_g34956 [Chara braunii]|eukprot:GBG82587.1 hypothetical protein CBR_g34956 [Chara braunii]